MRANAIQGEMLFQSTPLHEGRPNLVAAVCRVSCFNPRPCMRGDRIPCFVNDFQRRFQSTPLHEGRPRKDVHHLGGHGFNPRPCMRGDRQRAGAWDWWVVSIHAPA